jgi:hypothetical protein
MGSKEWAERELATADLGDARLTRRLVDLVGTLAEKPSASLPQACADGAQLKAAYRFFDHDEVTPEAILAGHQESTVERLETVPVVLAVQDTTDLDYTSHRATTGLGALHDAKHQGLVVHGTLAFTPEGLCLGVLQQQVWTRDPAQVGKRATRRQRPITEKESHKWLGSLEAVGKLRTRCPETRFISIGDREADVYDLFLVDRPAGVELLVRAAWDRRVADAEGRLWATATAAPVVGTQTLAVPARGQQPARTATVTVRATAVTLRPPKSRAAEHLPTRTVTAIWAGETAPPPGADPLEWLLLTTCSVTSPQDVLTALGWYRARWGIEIYHKILKSGCRIETRQLAEGDRLKRCLALYSVIAWRLLNATLLARELPDLPCTVLLTQVEWQALVCQIQRNPTPPETPPTLRQAVRWIAQLGGFLGRKGDGEPGVITLWRGFQSLADLTAMYSLFQPQRYG